MAKELRILLAEDEETDVLLLRRALKRAGLPHELIVAKDGQQAIDHLSGGGTSPSKPPQPVPSLVLLDLKMPRVTGFEVLAWLQSKPEWKALPAVVFTSSADESDRQRAHQLGAAAYLVKPPSLEGLIEAVRTLQERFGSVESTEES